MKARSIRREIAGSILVAAALAGCSGSSSGSNGSGTTTTSGGGTGATTTTTTGTSTEPTPPPSETPDAGAVSATPASSAPLTAGAADPRDQALGAFVHDVSQAIVAAALGHTVDRRWVGPHPVHNVTAIPASERRYITELGTNLTILGSEAEIDAIAQPSPNEHHQVLVHTIVLPDNSVHYGTVSSRSATDELLQPTPGLETSAPAIVAGTARIVEALHGPCALPWYAASDSATLPEAIQHELIPDAAATHATCGVVAGVHGDWRTHIDDIRVFVRGAHNHLGILRSTFNVANADTDGGGRLVLGALHVEIVAQPSAGGEAAPAAGGADATAPAAAADAGAPATGHGHAAHPAAGHGAAAH